MKQTLSDAMTAAITFDVDKGRRPYAIELTGEAWTAWKEARPTDTRFMAVSIFHGTGRTSGLFIHSKRGTEATGRFVQWPKP